MKLATYRDGSRDGQLVVVSRDLRHAHYASATATRLQQVLDDWNFHAPQLEELSQALNHGRTRHAFAFEPARCMAPLPRAYQRVVGSAFPKHRERIGQADGSALAHDFDADPLMQRDDSSELLGACDDIVCASADLDIDFGAGLAVVTADIARGASADAALEGIRLVMLANDVTLRSLMPAERAKGFGCLQSQAATAFSPVAVTLDELGAAWQAGRLHLDLDSTLNGEPVGHCNAGPEMRFHFGQLIAHIAETRNVRAGSIVGSGCVSNGERSRGCSCIAERRALETIEGAAPQTAYLRHGDRIRIDAKDEHAASVFGAIDQTVNVHR
jgi:fumarylacetoacetate (FAA) hydrolase